MIPSVSLASERGLLATRPKLTGVRVRVQAMVAELTKKLSACQLQLSSAQERCSQLDKEKQQAVSDLQSTRQVSVTGTGARACVCVHLVFLCGRAMVLGTWAGS